MKNDKTNLPVYSLFIRRWDLRELNYKLRPFDDPVPAKLFIEDMNFDISTKFRGNYTRKLRKRSYFIKLKRLQTFNGAREFHLNAEYKDPSSIRNKLSLDLFQSFGVLSPDSQHVQLFLNGNYEGVYLQLESVDDLFLEKRGLPYGPIYYAVKTDANFSLDSHKTKAPKESLLMGYQRKIGMAEDDKFLIELIQKINTTSLEEFEHEIPKYLAVEKYLRWLAVAVCTQNHDGFLKNYTLYRSSKTGLFEIIPWDYDGTFGREWNGEAIEPDSLCIKGKNHLTKKLLEIPAFRKQYRELMDELLSTLFTPAYLEPIISSLMESIRPHLLFSDPSQLETFDGEKEVMITFIKERRQYLQANLKLLE
ncbi:CotH kinase family protein [Bacillus sp. X1(2014)]|uniref:CotH kinase family protein n=1 Tax=Bacillus sp. X1(2014) TaxID=1565991 RepID=UPI0011A574A1|nr:CotH kinase family protein [Bacillus sp. X1(2014)]